MNKYRIVYFDDNDQKRFKVIKALDIDDALGIGLRYVREVYGVLVDVYPIKSKGLI